MNDDERAFALEVDGDHLGDDDVDASLVKFEGSSDLVGLIEDRPLMRLPERICFEANTDTLKQVDYPINDQAWPIMSTRMLGVLRAVGDFPHRAIPLIMLDDTVEGKFDAAGPPRLGVANHDFVAVQLTSYTDAFDWDRSEYTRSALADDRILKAKRLVLTDAPLPPLFRLSARPGPLLVSAAARAALEKAGIGGVRFVQLKYIF